MSKVNGGALDVEQNDWRKRMFCNGCDWSTKPSFGDPWFVSVATSICPNCATPFYTSRFNDKGYTMKTVRWVRGKIIKGPWWKPNKFGPGYWKEKEKNYVESE